MKLLLDECVDRRLARELPGHFVRTVPQMGWATIKNGRLLAEKEFDFFVTVDRNLSFQQNLPKFDIAVAVRIESLIGHFKQGGAGCDDLIAHSRDMKFRAREAGERAFDTETDGFGKHIRKRGCRRLRGWVECGRANEDSKGRRRVRFAPAQGTA